ncbi:hypothetical protein KCU83_g129, partial [Aureobasidium melanogenum]
MTATGESNELENVGANSAGDNVSSGNLLDDFVLISLAVDGAGVDNGVHNIDKDDFISGVVQELGNEAYRKSQRWYIDLTRYLLTTTDVTTAKVNCLHVGHFRLEDKGAKQSHETIRDGDSDNDNDNSDLERIRDRQEVSNAAGTRVGTRKFVDWKKKSSRHHQPLSRYGLLYRS